MRVALYQINSDRDTFNTKFMSWRWRTDHDYIILPEEYDKVFDGDIQARSLAEIFVLFNVMPPEGFVGHSASVSDVIAIYDENDNPSYHFVDSAGFVDVDFGMRYAVDALQKQDSPISIREYMAMANIENERWFDVADTVTLNSITIGKIETKEVPSQYSSLYALYHFSDLLSRKIQFLGTSCKDNFVIGNLSGYVRENELLFRSYALSHWSITPDTDTSSFVNQMVRELKGNLSGNLPEEEYEDLCMVIEATKGVEDTHIAKVKYEDCTISYTCPYLLDKDLQEWNRYGKPIKIELYKNQKGKVAAGSVVENVDRQLPVTVLENPWSEKPVQFKDGNIEDMYQSNKSQDYFFLNDAEEKVCEVQFDGHAFTLSELPYKTAVKNDELTTKNFFATFEKKEHIMLGETKSILSIYAELASNSELWCGKIPTVQNRILKGIYHYYVQKDTKRIKTVADFCESFGHNKENKENEKCT